VSVPMMFVVNMSVVMLQCFVPVLMLVSLGEM
jgi:hypothetical protein